MYVYVYMYTHKHTHIHTHTHTHRTYGTISEGQDKEEPSNVLPRTDSPTNSEVRVVVRNTGGNYCCVVYAWWSYIALLFASEKIKELGLIDLENSDLFQNCERKDVFFLEIERKIVLHLCPVSFAKHNI